MGEKRMFPCMCNWVTLLYSRKKNYMGEITTTTTHQTGKHSVGQMSQCLHIILKRKKKKRGKKDPERKRREKTMRENTMRRKRKNTRKKKGGG